jgi:hypothetical protein
MKRLVLSIFLVLAALAAWSQTKYEPTVKEISFSILLITQDETTTIPQVNYCIYIGNEDSKEKDKLMADSQVIINLSLVHPVPEVLNKVDVKAKKRWFAAYTDTTQGFSATKPLLTKEIWKIVPARIQHVLLALGIDDLDLILISHNMYSGGTNIYYQPKYDKDKDFYSKKVEILKVYFDSHDVDQAIPLEKVSPDEVIS